MSLKRRRRPSSAIKKKNNSSVSSIISLESLVNSRNFSGASTYIEFLISHKNISHGESLNNCQLLQWLAYIKFHSGEYLKSFELYDKLYKLESDPRYNLYKGCCLYKLNRLEESMEITLLGPGTRLQNRLLLHIHTLLKNENDIIKYDSKISDTIEDQLSKASIYFNKSQYQDAYNIYKKEWLQNREQIAIQIYVGYCFYELDRYETSNDIIKTYLDKYPNSLLGNNLKACNIYKLYNGKLAEEEISKIITTLNMSHSYNKYNDIISHNLVVFRNGENALKILPPLIDIIKESKLNLVIYYLNTNEYIKAYELIKDLQPNNAIEYILKAIVSCYIGQLRNNEKDILYSSKLFEIVGQSESEQNTISGRQCMASFHLLNKNYQNSLIYLDSIKEYMLENDIFYFNYGQILFHLNKYSQSEEAFLNINNINIKSQYIYLSYLCKLYIINDRPWEAWQLYLQSDTNSDSWNLLYLIANECYKFGHFYYSAKAFDALEALESNVQLTAQYWLGKRGACCGVFQLVIAGKEMKEHLLDIMQMLINDSNPQATFILRVMKQWCRENGIQEF